jgi:hypothetical protein
VLLDDIAELQPLFSDSSHQKQPSARRVVLFAEDAIGGTGGKTEPAVHTRSESGWYNRSGRHRARGLHLHRQRPATAPREEGLQGEKSLPTTEDLPRNGRE